MRLLTLGPLGRELSRFEMMLALILIGILIVVFMHRLDKMAAYVEQTRFVVSLSSLRQGLNNELIEKVILHDYDAIMALDYANPFAAAVQAPSNYLGVLSAPVPAELEPGNWYFDDATRHLVYLVDAALEFDSELAGPRRIRLETNLIYEDDNGDSRYTAGERLLGIQLRPVDQVSWNNRLVN